MGENILLTPLQTQNFYFSLNAKHFDCHEKFFIWCGASRMFSHASACQKCIILVLWREARRTAKIAALLAVETRGTRTHGSRETTQAETKRTKSGRKGTWAWLTRVLYQVHLLQKPRVHLCVSPCEPGLVLDASEINIPSSNCSMWLLFICDWAHLFSSPCSSRIPPCASCFTRLALCVSAVSLSHISHSKSTTCEPRA